MSLLNHCDPSINVAVRYSSSSNRIYAEAEKRGGCISLSEISENIANSPLYSLGDNTWNLDSDLYIEDGVTLNVIGEELRLLSNSETIVNLRGHGGSLYFDEARVISWDDSKNGVDENQDDGRSYISCISEVLTGETCLGNAKNDMGECRMDIFNSEIAYLGYHASESWGLSYKVRGFCKDKSNPEIFDDVRVRGDIKNSLIHHNYYGHYSFGHLGGVWVDNEIHSNTIYGFDPHDYSEDLIISDNVVYNNGNHGIIASKWCSNVTITNNVVSTSNVGIFLHSLGDFSTVKNNEVSECDSGIAYLESSHGIISGNTLKNNRIGIRFSVGSVNNTVSDNVIEGSETSVSTFPGSDTPVEADSGRVSMITFSNNVIMGGKIQIKESDKIVFFGNTIDGNVDFRLQDSSALITDDVSVSLSGDSCVDSKSLVDGELCDFEIKEVSEVPEVLETPSPTTKMNFFTSSPTFAPVTSSPAVITSSPTVITSSPTVTSSPVLEKNIQGTLSPVDIFPVEPENTNGIPVSGSSKLGLGLKELIIPVICLFFIK